MNTTLVFFAVGIPISLFWLLIGTFEIFRKGLWRTTSRQFVNSNEASRKWLIDHLSTAQRNLLIVSGNLNPEVYTQEFVDFLCTKLETNKGFTAKILSGPEILTLNNENLLYNLSSMNSFPDRLFIQFLAKRPVQHFRVIDDIHLFVEDPHGPFEKDRMVSTLENSFFKGWMYKREFERRWEKLPRAESVSLRAVSGGAS